MRQRSPKRLPRMIASHSLQGRAFTKGRALVCYERKSADLSALLPLTRNPQPGLTLATPRLCAASPVDSLDSPSNTPSVLVATDSLCGACSHRARRISRNHSPYAPLWPAMRQGSDAVKGQSGAQRRAAGNGADSPSIR